MPAISLIICTHNPRPDYLQRVLDALRVQTLPTDQWELLLIDNASKESVASVWDLSWHPLARHIREDELGLTMARLRGIREATGDFLIFADDDNVLAADYLGEVVSIFNRWPMLGAIGASIKGEFEVSPPDWIAPYLETLVVCELEKDHWSNFGGWSRATPYGAGLCVRRGIAEDYAQKVRVSQLRRLLDRSGTGLLMGGDLDLAWCAIDLGMGIGRFTSLKLTHLISKGRLTENYIVRLEAAVSASYEILGVLRNHGSNSRTSNVRRIRFLINYWRANKIERKIMLVSEKTRSEARKLVASHQSS